MYRLPDNFDVTVFVGRTLEQVCFTVNTVSFSFDGELRLTVEGAFQHQVSSDGAGLDEGEPPVRASRLMQLAGEIVARASADLDSLSLFFRNGQRFRCHGDSMQFESFRVVHRGKETIV